MKIGQVILKWKFNKALIAKRLGLSRSGLQNKLSDSNQDKLTEKQLIELEKIRDEMIEDLKNSEFTN